MENSLHCRNQEQRELKSSTTLTEVLTVRYVSFFAVYHIVIKRILTGLQFSDM